MIEEVLLSHGSGGALSGQLIRDIFVPAFDNEYLAHLDDGAIIDVEGIKVALTTDTYVVKPLFFPGGNIGKLAVAGTINDLAVMGARPLALTCGMVIEAGLSLAVLEQVTEAIATTAKAAGVPVVTGDTKVVETGKADGLYVNTAGIGIVPECFNLGLEKVKVGDVLIINGGLGHHALAVLSSREDLGLEGSLESDCAALNGLVSSLEEQAVDVKFMRDLTRGGLAGVVNEIIEARSIGVELREKNMPLEEATASACELLGLDPLYLANEGKLLLIVAPESAAAVLRSLRRHSLARKAAIVGEIVARPPGKAYMVTAIGTRRVIEAPVDEELPRIC